jgi:hypothetical protein
MNTFRYVTLLLIFLASGCEQAPDAVGTPDALQGPDATTYVFPDAQSSPSDTGFVAPDEGANTPDPTPSDDPTAPPTTEGGACVSGEPDDYPSCCDLADTRCVPKDQVEAGLHSLFASCEEGSVCVAVGLFTKSGTYSNTSCSSIMGAEGACTTKCSPSMAGFLDVLPQDSCQADELCAPCVSPLTGQETGACHSFSCTGDFGGSTAEPETDPLPPQASCENLPEEPLVDPTMFPTCCEGARCVPDNLVDAELAKDLDSCAGGLCVPEDYVAYAGFFKPQTCSGPGGEGRCLSKCLPGVAEKADLLSQDVCKDDEVCAPCCDPLTGENTGACDSACDSWTADGGVCQEVEYDLCCSGEGHCLPEEIIPEGDLQSVVKKGCSQGNRCVPDEMSDPTFQPLTCENNLVVPFIGEFPYEGVCLSKCLKIPLDFLIWSGTCPQSHDCVPCDDPLTGKPTGAPGC